MDWRRFTWVLLALGGAIVVLSWYALRESEKARQPASQPVAQTAPADEAATRPAATTHALPASAPTRPATAATATAATEPASRPAPVVVAASQPAATQPALQWFDNSADQQQKYLIGSLDPAGGYVSQVELISEGAAINTVKLANYFVTVDDKRLHDKDPAAYEEARQKNPRKYKGHYSLLNPVFHDGALYLPLMTRKISVKFPDGGAPLDWDLHQKQWRAEIPASQPADAQSIRFVYKLMRGADYREALAHPVLQIVKTYTVRKKEYSVGVSLRVENLTEQPLEISINQAGPTGVPQEDRHEDGRQAAYAKLKLDSGKVQPSLKPKADADKMKLGEQEEIGRTDTNEPGLWVGEVNRFFGSMMYLVPAEANQLHAPELKARFYLAAVQETATSRTYLTGVDIPPMALGPSGSAADARKGPSWKDMSFDLFAGPKKRDMFSDKGSPYFRQRYKDLNYLGTIDLKGCFCSFDELALGMMWVLQKLAIVSLGNYGVAVILLVLLVRIVLHPLTKKGQVSMSKMQKLAPKIAKLKEKYGDDKTTLNKETMKLYKEAGATPILGCLPMLLQMPIWIALWTGINASVELRHAAFLPFWLTDLAAPDALFSWDQALPLIGYSFNLLPILLTVAMYFQTQSTPQMTGASTPQQAQQQKMMKWMMPGLMLVFFYKMPTGLTLYVMASTVAGLWEQRVIRRHIERKEAAVEAAETRVEVPGKAARASRPKKPRGPFWFKHG